MFYYGWTSGEELYHYGIRGQKWGERRYQNEDGSLTPEGMRRYGRLARRQERIARLYDAQARLNKGNRSLATASRAAAKRARDKAENYRKGDVFSDKSTATTQRVLADYRNLSDREFAGKYKASKATYAKRVEKWGDPHLYRTTGKVLTEEARRRNLAELNRLGKAGPSRNSRLEAAKAFRDDIRNERNNRKRR